MRAAILVLALTQGACFSVQPRLNVRDLLEKEQWEYRHEIVCPGPGQDAAAWTAMLNRLGKERWELVSVDDHPGPEGSAPCRLFTLKRRAG